MIRDILAAIAEAIVDPRKSAHRMLERQHGPDAVVLMVIFAWSAQTFVTLLLTGPRGPDAPPWLVADAVALLGHAIRVVVFAGLVTWIGGLFGGKGALPQALVVIAWHGIVSTALWPLLLLAAGSEEIGILQALLLMAVALLDLWILANFVAVLHRFRSPWGPMAVFLGIGAGMAWALLSIASP